MTGRRRAALGAALAATVLWPAGIRAQINTTVSGRSPAVATQPPNPNALRFLVTPFRMPPGTPPAEVRLGIDLAEALRDRIGDRPRELWSVPRIVINQVLSQSQFPPDSALTLSDLSTLGKQGPVNANETVHGTLRRMPDGQLRMEASFYHRNLTDFGEPLPPVTGKDVAAVAKTFAEQYKTMRKQIDPYAKCRNAAIANKRDSAATYARQAIAAYAPSMLGRLCLITAFNMEPKAHPDTIIRLGDEILARDSASLIALGYLREAYIAKGDQDRASQLAIRIFDLDPSNTQALQSAVAALANSGSPQEALPMIDRLLQVDPLDTVAIRMKLSVQLRISAFKAAFETADLLVKADTAAATADFFIRMVGTAQADTNPTRLMQYLEQGTRKFPGNATLQMAYFSELNRAARYAEALEAVKRAVAADPKTQDGMLVIVALSGRLGQTDSVVTYARRAIDGGVADSMKIHEAALALLRPHQTKAQADTTREAWQALLTAAQELDARLPSGHTKFFVGYGAAQVAGKALYSAFQFSQAPSPDKVALCADVAAVEKMSALAMEAMRIGGRLYSQQAGDIIRAITDNAELPGQLKTKYCK